MKLVHVETLAPAHIGDTLTDFRGETAVMTGSQPPAHSGSTGRVFVDSGNGCHAGYYPSVYGLKWVD